MDSVSVNREDIEALTQAVEAGTLPATNMLSSLVTALRRVADGEESMVTVTVDVESLQDTFDAAFAAEPAEHSPGTSVNVTFKIGR